MFCLNDLFSIAFVLLHCQLQILSMSTTLYDSNTNSMTQYNIHSKRNGKNNYFYDVRQAESRLVPFPST